MREKEFYLSLKKVKSFMKPESFYSPFFELFSFCGRVCMRGKANRDLSFFLEQGSENFQHIIY